jgi:hypothetical protein
MKKAAIAVSALLVCGTLTGILCMKDNMPAAPQAATPPVQQETTRQFYADDTTRTATEYVTTFSPVAVPEALKQHYTLNPNATQIITGNSGTMLLIPDNAFTDKNGNPVEGKVKLELVEAIAPQDLIAMNMGTMSDKGMLETGGTIYIGARSENGDELVLAEGKAIEAEIPAANRKPGMQLWQGETNADGSVSWKSPEPINEDLTAVPVETLAETGQETRVAEELEEAPKVGVVREGAQIVWWDWETQQSRFVTAAEGTDSVFRMSGDSAFIPGLVATSQIVAGMNGNRWESVNFADKKFGNTNIATAEFRSRLPYIRQSCDARIAHCYADHPQRALWKSDAEAADSLEKFGCPLAEVFREFAKLKQEKVDPKDPNTVAAMDAARRKAIENYSKRMGEMRAAMTPYKFGMKSLGWANIDRLSGSGTPIVFNARVEGIAANVQPTVSLLIPGRGIYLPGYKRPNGNYSFTHGENEQAMAYPQGEKAYVLAKTGTGSEMMFGLQEVVFAGDVVATVAMQKGTQQELDKALGNLPQQEKVESVQILDDWFTRSLESGGCICGWMTSAK